MLTQALTQFEEEFFSIDSHPTINKIRLRLNTRYGFISLLRALFDQLPENSDTAAGITESYLDQRFSLPKTLLRYISNTATGFGLLGTLVGMIAGFAAMSDKIIQGGADFRGELIGNVGFAMETTVAGLIIQIVAEYGLIRISKAQDSVAALYQPSLLRLFHGIDALRLRLWQWSPAENSARPELSPVKPFITQHNSQSGNNSSKKTSSSYAELDSILHDDYSDDVEWGEE